MGAAVFGIAWGLGGYCPGPSLVALGSGRLGAVVFVVAALAGLWLGDVARARRKSADGEPWRDVDPGDVPVTV